MTCAKNSNGKPFADAADSTTWQIETEFIPGEAAADDASSFVSGYGGESAGPPSRSLGLSALARCAVIAKQTKKKTMRGPDFAIRLIAPPRQGVPCAIVADNECATAFRLAFISSARLN